jgi:hypothetical protein
MATVGSRARTPSADPAAGAERTRLQHVLTPIQSVSTGRDVTAAQRIAGRLLERPGRPRVHTEPGSLGGSLAQFKVLLGNMNFQAGQCPFSLA